MVSLDLDILSKRDLCCFADIPFKKASSKPPAPTALNPAVIKPVAIPAVIAAPKAASYFSSCVPSKLPYTVAKVAPADLLAAVKNKEDVCTPLTKALAPPFLLVSKPLKVLIASTTSDFFEFFI